MITMPNRSNAGLRNIVNALANDVARLHMQAQPSGRGARGRAGNRRGRGRGRGGGSRPAANQGPQINSGMGGIRVKHRELLKAVTFSASRGDTVLDMKFDLSVATKLAHLDALAKVYERYKVHQLSIHYEPAVGSTKDGVIVLAVDWDNTNPITLGAVSSRNPSASTPFYGRATIKIPADRLMSQRWLYTSPGSFDTLVLVILVATGPVNVPISPGSIWVSYDVTLDGPKLSG